ncbi:MAG: NAD(P)-binding protein [Sphingomonadales bacterium]|nr:NAD(P)-binding protein [Sphingomonadales bacterium]
MIKEKENVNECVNEAFVRRAVEQSNLNVLRIALYQQTGDYSLRAMQVQKVPIRGGALSAFMLDETHHEEVREKAARYLLSGVEARNLRPSKTEARELMALFTGKPPSETELDYGFEELAFEEFPRDVSWSAKRAPRNAGDLQVTIIGAGVSGIAIAVQLERLGIRYKIIDRRSDIGGTWHPNDYPDARVDINTFLITPAF